MSIYPNNHTKKIVVKNYEEFGEQPEVPALIAFGDEEMDAHDGYHSFSELYEHRHLLWIAYLKLWDSEMQGNGESRTWRSKIHADETYYDGWFILGFRKEKGRQITYHLPIKYWDKCSFTETLKKAPEFDGHTSEDVIERLKNL